MMTAIQRAILAIFLFLPSFAQAQQGQGMPAGPSGVLYVLFIHCGPRTADDPQVKRLALLLAKQGYSLREPEEDQDKVGGPGVDYFADEARAKAQEVADAVNGYLALSGPPLDPGKKLQPRRQNVKNAPNYLGVWLY
jgi:hypothetical protein